MAPPLPIASEHQRKVAALLDTGFNGSLALPLDVIETLDLEQTGHEQYMTASGGIYLTGVYEAVVIFGEQRMTIDEIVEAAEPLIGVGLVWNRKVCLSYHSGGSVMLEEL